MWVAELLNITTNKVDRIEEPTFRLLTHCIEAENWNDEILVAHKYERFISIEIYWVQD